MTEDEAKTKWCPFARFHATASDDVFSNRQGGKTNANCLGSGCMAWRWIGTHMPNPDDGGNLTKWDRSTYGFCGLAGNQEAEWKKP